MHRTRIKICGLTRAEDVADAVAAGADALGFVFYPKSTRHVTPAQAADLMAGLSPFVTAVGLFVNASAREVADIVAIAPVALLQFHGDESPQECAAAAALANRPYVVAVRVRPEMKAADLIEYEIRCRAASTLFAGLLLDAFVDGYGGGGKVFDWSVIPEELAPRVVLGGGLHVQNATDAVAVVRPHAVDVSSGVECSEEGVRRPGIKDAGLMAAFIAAVRRADADAD
ncbi:MAG: phosphoribosylanthranilate isomerase [Herminiimonas sp.]|nr:phosphoribosylanthranilate isomerase [Herminiimonas sp.]